MPSGRASDVASGLGDTASAAYWAVWYRTRIARRLASDWRLGRRLVAGTPPDLSHLGLWCSFIATPRSGHSLLGAMLDAHPDAVVSSEYGILDNIIWRFPREVIAALLLEDAKAIPHNTSRLTGGTRAGGYRYSVEGQWQGRARNLVVLGDKNGSADTIRFGRRPWLVGRLERTMQAPVRFIHVYRNPFDVVSTMVRRARERGGQRLTVTQAVTMVEARTRVHRRLIEEHGPQRVYSLAHEAHLQEPRRELEAVVRWLGLEPEPDYLDACAALCFAAPRKTRTAVDWKPEEVDRVVALIERVEFLRRYADDPLPV